MLGYNQSFTTKFLHSLTNRHSRNAKVADQVSLRRQLFAGCEMVLFDGSAQHAGNLPVRRLIASSINLPQLQHHTSPRAHL